MACDKNRDSSVPQGSCVGATRRRMLSAISAALIVGWRGSGLRPTGGAEPAAGGAASPPASFDELPVTQYSYVCDFGSQECGPHEICRTVMSFDDSGRLIDYRVLSPVAVE